MRFLALALCACLLVPDAGAAPAADYARIASEIAGAALVDGGAHAAVSSLCDEVGARFAGTDGLARAVDWAVAAMVRRGLINVHKEKVKVPRWRRGMATAEVLKPVHQALHPLALGGSVATPEAGVEAEIVVVDGFDALSALGEDAVRGKIVVFNRPMMRTRDFAGYGEVVPMRSKGAVAAARLGAVAALYRSAGTGYYQLPHTGATRYEDNVPPIPFAAITNEDGDLLARQLARGGAVRVRLRLDAKLDGEVDSANVVGEVPGREKPNEIVLIGAHLDSWDVGQGALDDGAGVAMVLETARLLRNVVHLKPRRTVRVVLFTNEEFGLSGARAYAAAHQAELARHVAALEADAGAGRPHGLVVTGGPASVEMVKKLARPLERLFPQLVVKEADHGGADLLPLLAAGVPSVAVLQDVSSYFDWHHTVGDTVDKIDPVDLALATTAFATMTFFLAESSAVLPPPPPPPDWAK